MLFSLMFDDTGIENTIETIKPTIRSESKSAWEFVGIVPTKPRKNHFGFTSGFAVGAYFVKKKIWCIGNPDASMP